MSVSATMEVVTTTAMTQMEVILVPVITAIILTVMDILVKVCKLYRSAITVIITQNLDSY